MPLGTEIMLIIVLIGLLLAGCAGPPRDGADEPDIRGVVTAVEGGRALVEANPQDASGPAKAWVRLTPQTRLRHVDGRSASAAALRVGQRVAAWFTGPVMESYPVQATARELVIEAEPGDGGVR